MGTECDANHFVYTVTDYDVAEAGNPLDVLPLLAERFGIDDFATIRPLNPFGGAGYVVAGERVCIPGSMPQGYTPPDEQPPGMLDILLLQELLTLIDYAETLALIADNENLIANRATNESVAPTTRYTDDFLNRDRSFVVQLKNDILELACATRYPDPGHQISTLTGVSYSNAPSSTGCDDNGGGLLQMSEEIATTEEVEALLGLRSSILAWANENRIPHPTDNTLYYNEDTGKWEPLLQLDYESLQSYHQAREANETRPYEEAAEHEANRRDLLAKLDVIRPVLENWPQVRDARRASLETLNGHIATMKTRQVLLDIHTGEIIHTFRRFHDGMSDYFSLLDTMVETIDLERIDWLLLTPEQRIEQHRQETIRNELLLYNFISERNQLPLNLDDPTEFNAAVLAVLEAYYADTPGVSQTPDELARTQFSTLDPIATPARDPLETERIWEDIGQAAEVVFFVAGFIPVVGQILDATDVIAAIARGDIVGAAVILALPEGAEAVLRSLGRGMRRLADKAEDLLRRMGDDLIEEIARQTGKSADEIRDMIGLARGRGDVLAFAAADGGGAGNQRSYHFADNSTSSGGGSRRPPDNDEYEYLRRTYNIRGDKIRRLRELGIDVSAIEYFLTQKSWPIESIINYVEKKGYSNFYLRLNLSRDYGLDDAQIQQILDTQALTSLYLSEADIDYDLLDVMVRITGGARIRNPGELHRMMNEINSSLGNALYQQRYLVPSAGELLVFQIADWRVGSHLSNNVQRPDISFETTGDFVDHTAQEVFQAKRLTGGSWHHLEEYLRDANSQLSGSRGEQPNEGYTRSIFIQFAGDPDNSEIHTWQIEELKRNIQDIFQGEQATIAESFTDYVYIDRGDITIRFQGPNFDSYEIINNFRSDLNG